MKNKSKLVSAFFITAILFPPSTYADEVCAVSGQSVSCSAPFINNNAETVLSQALIDTLNRNFTANVYDFSAANAAPVPSSFTPALSPGASKRRGLAKLLLSEADPSDPLSGFRTADFRGLPSYAFAYLDELTTKAMDSATTSIDLAMFSVTLKEMPDAIARAKSRGVKVRMITDESHVYPKMFPALKAIIDTGIEVRSLRGTRSYGVMHNKICIYDNRFVTTGSYNWTFGATFQNYENMIFSWNSSCLEGYRKYWDWMWSNSRTLSQGPSPELPEGAYGAPPADPSPSMDFNGTKLPSYSFSPGGKTEDMLVKTLDTAKESVDAVTFTLYSQKLADAVIRAKERGIKVRFMMDKAMGKKTAFAKYLVDKGVEFRWSTGRKGKGSMHNKYAIFDGKLLETGSFNWTQNAELNSFENVMLTDAPKTIAAYQSKYNFLYDQAETPAPGDLVVTPDDSSKSEPSEEFEE